MLTQETRLVWESILEIGSVLNGFVLIGGTALALQIQHRYSEDLDLAYADTRLPRKAIDRLLDRLAQGGFKITPNDNPASLIEAESPQKISTIIFRTSSSTTKSN